MYTEDQLLAVSALQHYVFCPRQCALIHIEQQWAENLFTAEGRALHDRTHEAGTEGRPGLRVVRGLRVHSLRLGLAGQADVVEFHQAEHGISLPDMDGLWRPFPVEYKRGRAKPDLSDDVQLCAQAICLEEMLGTTVNDGALFYGRPRHRKQVEFSKPLRQATEEAAIAVHRLLENGITPKATYTKGKCDKCSLLTVCIPKVTGICKDIEHYLAKAGIDQ